MIDFKPGRAYASDVKFRLGLAVFSFDLVSAIPSGDKDTAFKLACPLPHGDSGGPAGVVQLYSCVENDPQLAADRLADVAKQVSIDELPPSALAGALRAYQDAHPLLAQHACDRMREHVTPATDTTPETVAWVTATPEEIVQAKAGTLDKNDMQLSVHPADQVLRTCRPGTKGYLLRPTKTNRKVSAVDEQMYAAMRAFVEQRPDLMFVGELRLRDSRDVYRITVFDGQLYAEQLVMPSVLRERDTIDVDANPDTVDLIIQLAESQVSDFDEANHTWDVAAEVAALIERNAAIEAGEDVEAPAVAAPAVDVTAMLRAALAGAKAA